MHWVILWTDSLIYCLVAVIAIVVYRVKDRVHIVQAWRRVFKNPLACIASCILLAFIVIGLLDSVHIKMTGHTQLKSLFDWLISPLGMQYEKSYSAPLASVSFSRDKSPLTYVNPSVGIFYLILKGIITGALFWVGLLGLYYWRTKKQLQVVWRWSWLGVFIFLAICFSLSSQYHLFGTSQVGQDVFYLTLKSIRTGLVIGTLTTLVMLPFAITLGICAGYFGGIIDDVIQYIYTTLSSIPSVLLIAAAILSLQVYFSSHPDWFVSLEQAADARLLALCIILGITSWTGLCRLLRAETLKVREIDYVKAAHTLGSSHYTVLTKHILPNVMHLVIIAVVLDFSILVLAEAVLSYVGVGVDPTTISWGNMINSARLELAREPVVWWPILSAFVFMFLLVLSANIFADAVRDAFDPRS